MFITDREICDFQFDRVMVSDREQPWRKNRYGVGA
jgi:hypothetical protein